MKIAKKVLALAMAVAMVTCFTAMAFAAPAPTFKLEMGEVNKLGLYPVTLTAEDCVGLKAADVTITYDTEVLKFKTASNGSDAAQVGKVIDSAKNTFSVAFNEIAPGEVSYAFNFLEELWETAAWNDALSMDAMLEGVTDAEINGEDFEVAVLYFELVEGKNAADAVISFEGSGEVKIGDATVALVGVEKAEEETTAAPETTTAAPETTAPVTPETTNPGVVEGPDTGDTGLLAIAAGVVAVAGAAFVVSKKRK